MKTPRANEPSEDRDNQGPEKKRQDVKQASTPRSKTGSEEILNSGISAEAQDSRTQRSPWMNEMEGVHTGIEGLQSEIEGEQQERRNEEIGNVQGGIEDVQGKIKGVQKEITDLLKGMQGQNDPTQEEILKQLVSSKTQHVQYQQLLVDREKRLVEDKKRLEGLIPRPVQLRDSLSRPEVAC
ncbi:hypothetical protein GUITHDRAFT_153035 [Guillardia theta CCMP2712]|uniref:Uncharacterized protein n=1 Tax=Guillardia theta (strain CCMP2712) TaxID=905079 RepID=L1J8E9_GUITC|nr:hypothetical protein GUITHDRAFT_153035 [Guillardia theta CCMP2712]EKX44379.1 hypothetical protein GUITHDRAFT_153035 [Guillardia theta CCMP2712]|eukprot:XP_005831359.1 hypothetical protein GUITHDRAFT_153035 [Guillardia theta CCMP2712]